MWITLTTIVFIEAEWSWAWSASLSREFIFYAQWCIDWWKTANISFIFPLQHFYVFLLLQLAEMLIESLFLLLQSCFSDHKKASNLEAYVEWFNRLSYLVATEICMVSHGREEERRIISALQENKRKERFGCNYWLVASNKIVENTDHNFPNEGDKS